MRLEELGGGGCFPFGEYIAFRCADDVHGIDDAGHGVFADAEDGELDGGDAAVETAVVVGTDEERPLREEVGGAQGVHQFGGEEVTGEAFLDGDELGVDFLIVLPKVVGMPEVAHGVEPREHGGGEVFVLRRSRPMVCRGQEREDDVQCVVAHFFQRREEAFYAFLACRGNVLVGDHPEAVGREDEVEHRHGVEHGFRCRCHAEVVEQESLLVRGTFHGEKVLHRFVGHEGLREPAVGLDEVGLDFVEEGLLAGNFFEGVGDVGL